MIMNWAIFKNHKVDLNNISMRITKIIVLLLFFLFSNYCNAQQLKFLGLPMQSTFSEFSQVLIDHKFHDEYTSGNLAHQFWRYGDFWKINKCQEVSLFAQDNIHVDLINVDFFPSPNRNSVEEHAKAVNELISDLSDKYGTPNSIDTLRKDKEYYCHISTAHAENELFYVLEWNINEDKLLLIFNNSRVYIVQMRYISKERIRRINESLKFKGKGAADL